VLDPFLGSGTTTKVAFDRGRDSIGYEIGFESPKIEESWIELIKRKIGYYSLPESHREETFRLSIKNASPQVRHSAT